MTNLQKTMDKHQVIDHVEENVDALLAKLEGQLGEKVKILTEEEEQAEKELKAKVARELQERMHAIKNQKEQAAVASEQIEQELQNQEEIIAQEKQEKMQLEQMLQRMNSKLVKGG
jgi:excinuclease UvrABC nuclease subunit